MIRLSNFREYGIHGIMLRVTDSNRDIRSPQAPRLQYVESHNDDITEVSLCLPTTRPSPQSISGQVLIRRRPTCRTAPISPDPQQHLTIREHRWASQHLRHNSNRRRRGSRTSHQPRLSPPCRLPIRAHYLCSEPRRAFLRAPSHRPG